MPTSGPRPAPRRPRPLERRGSPLVLSERRPWAHGAPPARRFAHNSERQFAILLDFYGVAWEYEPTEFVIEWDKAGRPTQAFRPDFYLPAYDLYVEITTLNQKLVTKKNRKLRRLHELHPEIRVKILYQRDYLALLVKHGLEAPSDQAPADIEALPLRLDIDRPASRAVRSTTA